MEKLGGSRDGDDADVLGLSKGAPVFVRQGTDNWTIGTLLEKPSNSVAGDCLVQFSGEDSPQRVTIRDMAPAPIDASKNAAENITSLSFLHLPAVIDCLRVRYEQRHIYTRAGPVLVAVNPFESLQGLYTPELAVRYAEAAEEEARRSSQPSSPALPPHIFETASRAYSAMVSTGKSQSIIISGESGAGKTESAKLALRQVAALAAAAAAAAASSSSSSSSSSSVSAASAAAAAGDEFAALEGAILATNPVLEAFGNAKTSRNDNSSRFGKLVELLYRKKKVQQHKKKDDGMFVVAGARVSTCLLERSRLVARPAEERNFHILYQLVAGASGQLREELRLPPLREEGENSPPPPPASSSFRYLSGGPSQIEGVDDAAEFRKVVEALSAVGVSSAEDQRALWRALAGVLWLGNVDFDEVDGGEACEVSKLGSSCPSALVTAASLLGVRSEELERVLTTREITAGGGGGGGGGARGEGKRGGGGGWRRRTSGSGSSGQGGAEGSGDRVVKPLRPEEARSSRDALAKAVYSSLFDWLVARINGTLAPKGEKEEEKEKKPTAGDDTATAAPPPPSSSSPSISLLDIYGFECFQENGFEQLCINYANEHLQAQFNSVLLALEQEAYEGEGVDFSRVDWRSNEETLAALDARPGNAGSVAPSSSSSSSRFSVGLLALLDEACLVPGGSDRGFGLRVSEVLAAGGSSSSSSSAASSAASTPSTAKAFAAKSSSSFSSSSSSSCSVILGCPAGAGSSFSVAHAAGTVSYSTSGFLSKNRDVVSAEALALLSRFSAERLLKEVAEAATKGSSSKSTNSSTVASAFRLQLRSLLSRLDASQLHFVRCIKPNSAAAARSFDSALVAHQLRCAGVAEVARVARQGFPTRAAYSELAGRFSVLLPPASMSTTSDGNDDDDKTTVSALLSSSSLLGRQLGEDDYALGRTKVFMRAGVLAALEAELRARSSAATAISARFRGRRQRALYLRSRRAAVAIQAAVRARAARKLLAAMKREQEEERRRLLGEEEEAKKAAAAAAAAAAAEAAAAAAAKSTVEHSSSPTSSVENPADADAVTASVLRGAEKLVEAADAEAAAAAKRAAASGCGESSKKNGSSGKWLHLPKVPPSLQRRGSRSNEGGEGGGSSSGVASITPRPPPPASGAAEIALWEAYSERLEAQVAGLLRTNRALQGSLAAAKADGCSAGNSNSRKKSCFSSCASSVSSYPSPNRSAAAEHASSLRALDALYDSLGKREALFEDDALFLEEVASGAVTAAPGFHLFEETKRLRKRFASFVGSFTKKMEATEVMVLGAAEAKKAATEETAAAASVVAAAGGGEGRQNLISASPSSLQGGGKERTGEAIVSLQARAA